MPDPMPEPMPDPGPDTVHLIPLAEIDADALTRDRTAIDAAALTELTISIAATGLRQPVELFRLADESACVPRPGGPKYGILSGYRRLAVFRAQHALTGAARYAAIPAFLRVPADAAAAFVAMVEENAIRADLSPWERGRVAVTARDQGVFASLEEAVDTLYASASRQKRSKLRTIARVAEDLDGALTDPETLSEAQLLRLAPALDRGFRDLILTALGECSLTDPATQWTLIAPILREVAEPEVEYAPRERRPGRPRRLARPRHGLTLRREVTRDGYILHITGREARGPLIDHVFEEIERLLGPA